ncbi:hypothetical protein P606_13385 [Comamonas thiooxydans]|nr:hypothetical protein P606_13385 [Comamonas thiooxydans]
MGAKGEETSTFLESPDWFNVDIGVVGEMQAGFALGAVEFSLGEIQGLCLNAPQQLYSSDQIRQCLQLAQSAFLLGFRQEAQDLSGIRIQVAA